MNTTRRGFLGAVIAGAAALATGKLPTFIEGPRYRVEFYSFERLGGSIGHTGALARANF